MRNSYSVHVEARASSGPGVDDSLLDRLAEAVEPYHGVIAASGHTVSVTMTVEGGSPGQAALVTTDLLLGWVVGAAWQVVRVEAVREDVADEDLARPQIPELVSAPEIAAKLGVSRQRVLVLAQQAGFPRPMIERPGAVLWARAAVERWAESWDRKPGRPRKVA